MASVVLLLKENPSPAKDREVIIGGGGVGSQHIVSQDSREQLEGGISPLVQQEPPPDITH